MHPQPAPACSEPGGMLRGPTQSHDSLHHMPARSLLQEDISSDPHAVWVVGLPPCDQAAVHASLMRGVAASSKLLHTVPGGNGKQDSHHWMVRASAEDIAQLLQAHPQVTAVSS